VDKSIFKSKTFWTNVVAFVAAVSTAFGVDIGLDADSQVAIVGGVMAVVNIVLRVITKDPVRIVP